MTKKKIFTIAGIAVGAAAVGYLAVDLVDGVAGGDFAAGRCASV